MKRRLSMRYRITLLYLLTASMLAPIIYLLREASSGGISAQLSSAKQTVAAACEEIQQRFSAGSGLAGAKNENEPRFQDAILEIILSRYDGVEGGFWTASRGFQSYAFPTYDGASPKKDVPRSEMNSLAALTAQAIAGRKPVSTLREGKREAVLSYACPVAGSAEPTAAWVLYRVPISSGEEFEQFGYVSLALLLILLLTGGGSLWTLHGWTSDLRRLLASIEQRGSNRANLPASAEPDLQKIVHAFNEQSEGLRKAHEESLALARRLAQSERLALLGQMAAGIAHEIRNPIASIKLKLENAEVHPAERMPKALPVVRSQLERVERLIEMLLSFSRPFTLHPEVTAIKPWIEGCALVPKARGAERSLSIESQIGLDSWSFDAFHLGRALENLLLNAVEFSPESSRVLITARDQGGRMIIEVQDSGPGISPEQRAVLFQPFSSTREGGLGLGLILAKEIVEAHGGALSEVGDGGGACFRMEVPWPKS